MKGFTPSDLHLTIARGVGLPNLIPKALDLLAHDPFLEADYYPGDLLITVCKVDDAFWQNMPDLRRRAVTILDAALERAEQLDVSDRPHLWPELVRARARFA
jgi:hypothetical protein